MNTYEPGIFSYEAESLGQWKIDRGNDMHMNAWGLFIGVLFTVPPLAVVILPFVIRHAHKGKKLANEGRSEGAKGKPYVCRGSESIAPNQRELRCDKGVRRVEAPYYPPSHLLNP